ncbi:MAG TPA: multicopper oxidase domain-containing protein [Candidatus Udaeobacter sp.]|jgi:FtsP/CotA-like multicopper oxidase with cupredoxin domain
MKDFAESPREFLKTTGVIAGGFLLCPKGILAQTEEQIQQSEPVVSPNESSAADYTLHIETSPVEIAPKRIISATTYNGQFPGPLLRFKEGQQVTVDVFNDTDTPEQLHWHGQKIPTDVDGAAEEGTPFIPAHGKRRIVFTPRPAGLRFYHTHNRAGANLAAGQYSGQVGPVYIEPKQDEEKFASPYSQRPAASANGRIARGHHGCGVRLAQKEVRPPFDHGRGRQAGQGRQTHSV